MSQRHDPVDDSVLDEQLAYYRARAPEYDDWFERLGRFDRGAAATLAWHDEVAIVREWLATLELAGKDVLELAAGTGIWTAELLAHGATVTAVDAAPEMLDRLRQRVGGASITTIGADLFTWEAPYEFDAVVSCFFMSHVPDEQFDRFLDLVASSVGSGGPVFLLDSARNELSTAVDHTLPDDHDQTMRRRLDDGRSFQIVKRFRSDAELAAACARHGLVVDVRQTPQFFQVAMGARHDSQSALPL
ncbi:MAG TPA: class I SAM-dependent methyltransferase [Acidimicrobiales bacterium]|nr:class I SAM-dependent methyltransferase [Acidimicrobiales bacterium]